jgi:hypothetical protein
MRLSLNYSHQRAYCSSPGHEYWEPWWNGANRGNLSQCHFAHHISHVVWPGLRGEGLATNRLSHGTASSQGKWFPGSLLRATRNWDWTSPTDSTVSHSWLGRAMVHAVSCWPLTTEAHVRAQVILCGICGGHSGTGTESSLSSSVFSFNIILSILICHPGDEQEAHCGRSSET